MPTPATQPRLGLIHTSATLVPMFEQLCREQLPHVAVFNLVDDSLIKDVIAHGRLRPATARRVVQHVAAAEAAVSWLATAASSSCCEGGTARRLGRLRRGIV